MANRNEKENTMGRYRITYRNEVYVNANSHDEAEQVFRNMPRDELDRNSEFVEIVSNEKDD